MHLTMGNLPKLESIPADADEATLQAAHDEAMALADAALNTRLRDGTIPTDLAGSYLARAGAMQLMMRVKKQEQ